MRCTPALIENFADKKQNYSSLEAISLLKPPYDEDWLQDLIHTHPGLVPAGEVEACFENIVPILREFSLPSGYLDNFYITPDGYPVLVEVKLWKNQEARRKVVAQILEYAKDFANLAYEDINKEIRKQLKEKSWGENPLYEMVSEYVASAPDEVDFVNRVTRNLKQGRFLLLVLGDGIREEMAALADYLMHHSLRYAFGMVEVRLFTFPDGSVLALPHVIAKTQLIERHVTIVTLKNGDATVQTTSPVMKETIQKASLSLDEFYALLNHNSPQSMSWLKHLQQELSDLPFDLHVGSNGDSLMLKASTEGGLVQLMLKTPTKAEFWGVPHKHWNDPAWQTLSRSYLQRLCDLIPGSYIKEYNRGLDLKHNDTFVPLHQLHGKEKDIAQAMRQVLSEIDIFFQNEPTAV